MLDLKIALIGAGQMGGALLSGILSAKVLSPTNLSISDVNKERIKELSQKFGVTPSPDNISAVKKSKVVILAVKPQNVDDVLREIAPHLDYDHLLISIAAGITIEHIFRLLKKKTPLIRVMPNMGAFVRKGVSILSPSSVARDKDIEIAKEIFSSVGEVVLLDEKYMDVATAISGCGPAYFAYLVEILEEVAKERGIAEEVAKRLAKGTLMGTAFLLDEGGLEAGKLREKVTSPGGMTEKALETFKEVGLKEGFKKGIEKAIERAKELSK